MRPNMKNWIYGALRAIPMPILTMGVGLLCGVLAWAIVDPLQNRSVKEVLQTELTAQMQAREKETLIRFESYLRSYESTAHLLAHQQRMMDCVERLPSLQDEHPKLRIYRDQPPSWLPAAPLWISLVQPSHMALFDEAEEMREVYQLGSHLLPMDLIRRADFYLNASEVHVYLTTLNRTPWLLISEPVNSPQGTRVGSLMLVVPVDADFLRASQQGVLSRDAVITLVDVDSQRILASSLPSEVTVGSELDSWRHYFSVTSRSFIGYDSADLNIQFATLVPHSVLTQTTERILSLERGQRLVAAGVFIIVFTLAMYLVSTHINTLLRRLSRFSHRALGLTEPGLQGRNQLILLEDWISRFVRMVLGAREEMKRRHESEIRESEALTAAVVQNAHDCVIIMNSSGRIIEINATTARTFGLAREQALGRMAADLLFAPEWRFQFLALVQEEEVDDEGVASATSRELSARRLDGSEFPIELRVTHLRLHSIPVITLYINDISIRRKSEQEVESLAKFASESPNPILRLNDKGVILFANNASDFLLEYWGCSRGQTLPVFWRDLVRQVLELGIQDEREIQSEQRIYSLLLAPVKEFGYVNIFGRDITEVRRAEQQARRHQAELVHVCRLSTMGEMSTGMAHELNQPLSAIVNFARGGIRRLHAPELDRGALGDVLEQIAIQAERAAEIIRRLRSLVSRQPSPRSLVDMNTLVREVCSFVEHELPKLSVELELQLAPRHLPVRVDLVQIEQVLLNLIRNAMDALSEVQQGPRRLTIRTRLVGRHSVRLQVRDTGAGIPRSYRDKLFTPFFTTKPSGMGMGLPISKTIIDDHRGHIRVWTHPGWGTVFSLILPTYPELLDTEDLTGGPP